MSSFYEFAVVIIICMKLSEILKEIMRERNLTLNKLAALSDIPKSTIANWIDGHQPNITHIKTLAKSLGVSVHYLVLWSRRRMQSIYENHQG